MKMENVYLVGAEDVRSAGHTISSAATDMKQVASSIDWSVQQLARILEEHTQRMESILDSHMQKLQALYKAAEDKASL
jgi:hypothetical protein